MADEPATRETVLVVEDDVLVRMPIAQYLRDCGYKVIEAVSADEAMTVLLHRETVVDIVFSDLVCRLLLEKKKKHRSTQPLTPKNAHSIRNDISAHTTPAAEEQIS